MQVADVAQGFGFLAGVPPFLRRRVSLQEARETVARRLADREPDFVALVKRTIYGNPASPYLALLRIAGCEYGDLARLVRQEGVEGALQVLYRRGVYLSVDEFKGLRAVARGSDTFQVDTLQLRNGSAAHHLQGQSSGSSGSRTVAPVDLAAVRDWAINFRLFLHSRRADGWKHAVWAVPGGTTLIIVLLNGAVGTAPVRWFTQVPPGGPGIHPRYLWSERALRWGSLLAGMQLPRPEHVPLDDPLPVARWMQAVIQSGRTPRLSTFASSAVRLCQAATGAGIDIRGAQVTMFGESTTGARLATVRGAGVEPTVGYGSMECGIIGYGCLASSAPDDVHLFHDLHAVIQPGMSSVQGLMPPRTLLMTSLRAAAHFVLLNVSAGDEAVLTRRACGCPLEEPGWTTHLHAIRSFEKLTAGGMTFRDADVSRLLEEVLPARFGGGPTDYQLVEEVIHDGNSRLRLFVEPRIGPLDASAVVETFLGSLGAASTADQVMAHQWRGASLLSVVRESPRSTGGKILHLHQAGRSPGARVQ